MLQNGTAWMLVADGRRARVLVEQRRGAALEENWSMEIGEEDLYAPQDRPPAASIASAPAATAWSVAICTKPRKRIS